MCLKCHHRRTQSHICCALGFVIHRCASQTLLEELRIACVVLVELDVKIRFSLDCLIGVVSLGANASAH